jgi:integrase
VSHVPHPSWELLHRPHIPLLREGNIRKGFFEAEQLNAVLRRLPAPLRPLITFAYLTGWRIPSEVLTIEWRQVDFSASEVRLDPGTTKNREGRVFPFTPELRQLLEDQRRAVKELKRTLGLIVPWVFFRMLAKDRGGAKYPEPIRAFNKAWANACVGAGCPGRIPHDLRRTARSEPLSRRCVGVRRDAAHGAQDAFGVRTLQHRERR